MVQRGGEEAEIVDVFRVASLSLFIFHVLRLSDSSPLFY